MQRKKAVEIVGYSRRRAKAIGYMMWLAMIILGIIGVIFWKWYAVLIVLITGLIFGYIFSILQSKHIEKITGLDIHEQILAYSESLGAKNNPITKNPAAYKEYIDSIPDEIEELPEEDNNQKEVTPSQMALEVLGAIDHIMQEESNKTKKWDREKFRSQEGFEYDKKSMLKEYPSILTMIILHLIRQHFPMKEEEISDELEEIFAKNEMQEYIEGAKEYYSAWLEAEERAEITDDGSVLNNPFYCVSKLASIKCYGKKEGLHPAKIIMFNGIIKNYF